MSMLQYCMPCLWKLSEGKRESVIIGVNTTFRIPTIVISAVTLYIYILYYTYIRYTLNNGEGNGTVRISVYDKREDFNFKIVNFPYLDSNIPRNPAYGVYISQLVRYARICSRKDDFIYRHRRLSLKLQQQGYKYQQLMKSFHKFYRSHSDELKKFGTTLMELRSSI